MVARTVWPDDVFGRGGMSVEEEMEAIKNILFNPAAGEGERERERGRGGVRKRDGGRMGCDGEREGGKRERRSEKERDGRRMGGRGKWRNF